MYAIRSYYESGASTYWRHDLCTHITQPYGTEPVITSYSIHYTKLYELFQRVITVNLETLRILASLPKLDIE